MSLEVNLNGTATGFTQMLNAAKSQAKAFTNSVEHEVSSSWGSVGKQFAASFAGMFTVQGLKSGVDWFISTGKQIQEQAEQVDMSTDSWQKWNKAVEDAHLSGEGFARVLESLRQKRTDALTDPKARGDLSRLGFTDAEITGNMDMSTFLQRALANAHGGDLQRSYLSSIIGDRGLKYASALPNLKGESADFSPADIQAATDASNFLIRLGHGVGKLGVGAVDFARDIYHIFSWSQRDWEIDAMKRGLPLGKYADPDLLAQQAQQKKAASLPAWQGPIQPDKDPLDAKLAEQRDEMALHDQERQQRLLDSQRSLMTIGDRRASVAAEMVALQKQIADRNNRMKGEDFLTAAQKDELAGVTGKARTFAVNALLEKFQDQTDDMQLRLNKDKSDLREKPLDYSVDSMSKVGLYSASNAAFNPLLGVGQKTNVLLTEIKHLLTPNRGGNLHDPHSP